MASLIPTSGNVRLALLLASAVLASIPAPALAQTSASPASPETPICTDRPTKSNSACTVPEGDLQVESDVIIWTRSSAAGVITQSTLFTNPTVKYGLLAHLDLELNWAPWEQVRTIVDGHATTQSSVGDVVLRAKWEPVDGEVFSVALIPYVKLPTASQEVGEVHVKGGMLVPAVIKLPAEFQLTLQTELNAPEVADRVGAHFDVANLIDLSRSLGKWTLFAEIWNDQEFDPTGTKAQTTADVAASWRPTNNIQLDAGANLGLDRDAPAQQFYFGVSGRF